MAAKKKKKSAKKKGKLKGKAKAKFLRKMAAGRRKAARKAGKKPSKRKGGKKKAGKKKAGKRKSYRRCAPCGAANMPVIRKRLGKNKVKNVTCAIVKVGNSCRRICFTTVGKAHLKSGAINPRAKRFLLSNQPAKGCGSKKRRIPSVVLRGIVGL